MVDVIFWGGLAVAAVAYATVPIFFASPFNITTTHASTDNNTQSNAIDTIHTGSATRQVTAEAGVDALRKQAASEEGTTVAFKLSAAQEDDQPRDNKVKQPPTEKPKPIGIDLGVGRSFSALGKRFSTYYDAVPALFSTLLPRGIIVDTDSGLEAHLIAGPVESLAAAIVLCQNIRKRIDTSCKPGVFSGKPLTRVVSN